MSDATEERINDIIVRLVRTDDENVFGARQAAKEIAALLRQPAAPVQVTEGQLAVWARTYGLDEFLSTDKCREAYEAALQAGRK